MREATAREGLGKALRTTRSSKQEDDLKHSSHQQAARSEWTLACSLGRDNVFEPPRLYHALDGVHLRDAQAGPKPSGSARSLPHHDSHALVLQGQGRANQRSAAPDRENQSIDPALYSRPRSRGSCTRSIDGRSWSWD